jgi:gluconolactonase
MKEAVARDSNPVTRRDLIIGMAAGVAACAPRLAAAQAPAQGSHQSNPSMRDYTPGAPPVGYPDPDVITIDPAFNALRVNNTAIHRLWTGAMWSEGPAWCSQGRYLVWSDIPNNRQLRWLEENGQVSVFRSPSNNSNGNTYDFQGRQVACEHALRRLVRYEHDGSVTVLADAFGGMRLNSPNDVAPHPDGSYWFTDPPAGFQLYEGAPEPEDPAKPLTQQLRSRVGQLAGVGMWKREIPTANVYRVDSSGKVDMIVKQQDLPGNPNGILFAPDYKRLYIIANGALVSVNVDGAKVTSSPKEFCDFMVEGVKCRTDGARTDVRGNVWAGTRINEGRDMNFAGVTVWNPEGKLIGRIRLPEICANVTFGGPKRNRLFMTAGQSLYAVYTATQGAAPA